MIFTTQIRRKSDPSVLHPVVIFLETLNIKFQNHDVITGSPCSQIDLRIQVATDRDATGTPDVPLINTEIPGYDFESQFYPGALAAVDQLLRGSGNLMAGIRAYSRGQVDNWNTAQYRALVGDPEATDPSPATHADIDNDNPV